MWQEGNSASGTAIGFKKIDAIAVLENCLLFAIYQVMLEASSFSPTPVDLLHQECVSLDSIQVCIEQKPVF